MIFFKKLFQIFFTPTLKINIVFPGIDAVIISQSQEQAQM
jgi:hypothetical protein